jgi:hypothetical protein
MTPVIRQSFAIAECHQCNMLHDLLGRVGPWREWKPADKSFSPKGWLPDAVTKRRIWRRLQNETEFTCQFQWRAHLRFGRDDARRYPSV